MDLSDDWPNPKRGDRLRSAKNCYYVISAIAVKRRQPHLGRRFRMKVVKLEELQDSVRQRLLKSAIRRGGSFLFEFRWYPRKKKKISFEDYMRGSRS